MSAVGHWSWLVRHAEEQAPPGVLDLRSRTPLPGSTPVVEGEHVRPVPLHLPDLEATRGLGRRLAGALRPGDLVLLHGPLGAGKTSLTQGLADALGVRGRVTSPTFVLAREHRGPLPLLHVDAYRLRPEPGRSGPTPLDDLDIEAALEVGVVVVEWGEGLVEHLSPSRLDVQLDRSTHDRPDDDDPDDDPDDDGHDAGRTAVVRVAGPRWAVLPATHVTT